MDFHIREKREVKGREGTMIEVSNEVIKRSLVISLNFLGAGVVHK